MTTILESRNLRAAVAGITLSAGAIICAGFLSQIFDGFRGGTHSISPAVYTSSVDRADGRIHSAVFEIENFTDASIRVVGAELS